MGKLYIEEYDSSKKGSIATQQIFIAGSATTSSGMNSRSRFVRLTSDEDCFFAIDTTATTSDRLLNSKTDLLLSIKSGQTISVIKKTSSAETSLAKSAFNETAVSQITPVFQSGFLYNINSGLFNSAVTGSGAITQATALAKIDTTAATSSTARVTSHDRLRYDHGEGGVIRFAGFFTPGVANSTQLMGVGTDDNGLFFGYNGASFGIMRRQNGVDNWTAQSSWSEDVCDGTNSFPSMDFTKGNAFQIKFQWLGFGEIDFFIENPDTGVLEGVHRIQYANANTVPTLYNPTMPFCGYAANTTNDTSIAVYVSSVMLGVEGKNIDYGIIQSISNGKTGISTTYTNILTIRNLTTFASTTNESIAKLALMDIAVDGTKPSDFELVLNTTLGGSPSYSDVETNVSLIEYDTAGTTLTGGRAIFSPTLAKSDSRTIDLSPWRILLNPGDTATVAAKSSSGTIDAEVSLTWVDEF